jgi:hypothetical protein
MLAHEDMDAFMTHLLQTCVKLQSLKLWKCRRLSAAPFVQVPQHLREFAIEHTGYMDGQEGPNVLNDIVNAISTWPALRSLHAWHSGQPPAAVDLPRRFPPKLTCLDLRGFKLQHAWLDKSNLLQLTDLQTLTMMGWRTHMDRPTARSDSMCISDSDISALVEHMPDLRCVTLESDLIGQAALASLSHLRRLREVKIMAPHLRYFTSPFSRQVRVQINSI